MNAPHARPTSPASPHRRAAGSTDRSLDDHHVAGFSSCQVCRYPSLCSRETCGQKKRRLGFPKRLPKWWAV